MRRRITGKQQIHYEVNEQRVGIEKTGKKVDGRDTDRIKRKNSKGKRRKPAVDKKASKKRAPVSFRVQRENIKSSRRNCLE